MVAATAIAALATAGCGTPSPDLFVVERDGTVPGAKLSCSCPTRPRAATAGAPSASTSGQIIEARGIRRDLLLVQTEDRVIPQAPPAQIFTFAVQTEQGTLRYPDTQQRPAILPRLSRFVRRVAIDTCGLRR